MVRTVKGTRKLRFRRKVAIKKRRTGMSKGMLTAPQLHRFVRTSTYSNLTNLTVGGNLSKSTDSVVLTMNSATTPIQYGAGSIYFTLDSLPDYSEFANLFDSYRIECVSVKITPFFTQTATAAAAISTAAQTGVLWHDIIDTDDADLPNPVSDAGLQIMRQYKSYRSFLLCNGRTFKRKLYPRALMPAYLSSLFTAYTTAPKNVWYDMQNTNTPFFGYKFITEATNSGANLVLHLKLEVKMKISCKDVR